MCNLRMGLLLLLVLLPVSLSEGCRGCVSLDEYSMAKVLPHFRAVLVKFDVAYPYGDLHDLFGKFAEEVASVPGLLVGEVGVKDYGAKDNEGLALKYGVSREAFPALRLFVKGKETPVEFKKEVEWTLDSLRDLVRDHTDIYIGLRGCVEAFDHLAMEFSRGNDREKVLKKTEVLISEDNKATGEVYLKIMKNIIKNGADFVNHEITRLGKITKGGKIADKKKEELHTKINILRSFTIIKDEL